MHAVVAVVAEDVDDPHVALADVLRLRRYLEDLGDVLGLEPLLLLRKFAEDVLEDVHDCAFEGAVLVEEDVLVEPLAFLSLVDVQLDIAIGGDVADLFLELVERYVLVV